MGRLHPPPFPARVKMAYDTSQPAIVFRVLYRGERRGHIDRFPSSVGIEPTNSSKLSSCPKAFLKAPSFAQGNPGFLAANVHGIGVRRRAFRELGRREDCEENQGLAVRIIGAV